MPTPTLEQFQAHIRTIDRRCRGRKLLTGQREQDEWGRYNEFFRLGRKDDALDAAAALAQQLGMPHPSALHDDVWHAYQMILGAHEGDVGRPCNYDVNDLILKYPPNSGMHEEVCPSCGSKHIFLSARFD